MIDISDLKNLPLLKYLNDEDLNHVKTIFWDKSLSELCNDEFIIKIVKDKINDYEKLNNNNIVDLILNLNLSSSDGLRSSVRRICVKKQDNFLLNLSVVLNSTSVFEEMTLEKISFFKKESDNGLIFKLVLFSSKINQLVYGEIDFSVVTEDLYNLKGLNLLSNYSNVSDLKRTFDLSTDSNLIL